MKKITTLFALSIGLLAVTACSEGGSDDPIVNPTPNPTPNPGPDPTPTPAPKQQVLHHSGHSKEHCQH